MFETINPSLAFFFYILASKQNIFSYSGFITCGVTFHEEYPHQNSTIVPSSIRAISHVRWNSNVSEFDWCESQ